MTAATRRPPTVRKWGLRITVLVLSRPWASACSKRRGAVDGENAAAGAAGQEMFASIALSVLLTIDVVVALVALSRVKRSPARMLGRQHGSLTVLGG
jgi:hypothetical protein